MHSILKRTHLLGQKEQQMNIVRLHWIIMNSSDLAGSAYEIALENKTTFYDSLFLAAAQQAKVPLLTLDKKMYVAAKAKNNVLML